VSRRIVALTLENLADLPGACRGCVFWELDQVTGERARRAGDPQLEKEAWISDTLLQWGSCGYLAYVDEQPAGYVLYAPPAYVPRSRGFPTSPISSDSVLLMTARIDAKFVGSGLGRMLVQNVIGDAVQRGVKAIEAFGRVSDAPAEAGSGEAGSGEAVSSEVHCLVPADYLRAVGFTTVRDHPRTPRLRLDVRSVLTWREEVEFALDRLLGTAATLASR
jgi:GNAT superfamily N-acetyltransferase